MVEKSTFGRIWYIAREEQRVEVLYMGSARCPGDTTRAGTLFSKRHRKALQGPTSITHAFAAAIR